MPFFGKIGRSATVIHLLKVESVLVLLYGLNAGPLNAAENKSQRTNWRIQIGAYKCK